MSQTLEGFEGRLLAQALNSKTLESMNREVVSKVLMARKYSRQLTLHGVQCPQYGVESSAMCHLRSIAASAGNFRYNARASQFAGPYLFFNPNNTQHVVTMFNNKIRLLSAVLFASLFTGCMVPGSNINP